MVSFLRLLIPVFLVCCLLRLCMAPMGMAVKWLVRIGSGFACLWLLNLISGFTGLLFPINAVTALITGCLGLPGIVLLAGLQLFL